MKQRKKKIWTNFHKSLIVHIYPFTLSLFGRSFTKKPFEYVSYTRHTRCMKRRIILINDKISRTVNLLFVLETDSRSYAILFLCSFPRFGHPRLGNNSNSGVNLFFRHIFGTVSAIAMRSCAGAWTEDFPSATMDDQSSWRMAAFGPSEFRNVL